MVEPIDAYADQFVITVSGWGANLSFFVNTPHPEPANPVPPERIATIRMSNEHLKAMTIIIWRQVNKVEAESGVKYELDRRLLNSMGISPEDWEQFWKGQA